MKIAVLGATGWVGGNIVEEARARGMEVVALSRNLPEQSSQGIEARAFDVTDSGADLAAAVRGCDALVVAVGGRAEGNHDMVPEAARRLLEQLPATDTRRLVWVGGAGSLEVAPGVQLVSSPDFPDEYRAEALAQGQALEVFRGYTGNVKWTFVSPAADLFPGEKQGHYRVGGDQLLVDGEGLSRISVADYALALVDELENGKYPGQRIGVAY